MRAISVDGGIAYIVDPEKVILRRIEVEDNRFAGLSGRAVSRPSDQPSGKF
jgi:hypothetical protein